MSGHKRSRDDSEIRFSQNDLNIILCNDWTFDLHQTSNSAPPDVGFRVASWLTEGLLNGKLQSYPQYLCTRCAARSPTWVGTVFYDHQSQQFKVFCCGAAKSIPKNTIIIPESEARQLANKEIFRVDDVSPDTRVEELFETGQLFLPNKLRVPGMNVLPPIVERVTEDSQIGDASLSIERMTATFLVGSPLELKRMIYKFELRNGRLMTTCVQPESETIVSLHNVENSDAVWAAISKMPDDFQGAVEIRRRLKDSFDKGPALNYGEKFKLKDVVFVPSFDYPSYSCRFNQQ